MFYMSQLCQDKRANDVNGLSVWYSIRVCVYVRHAVCDKWTVKWWGSVCTAEVLAVPCNKKPPSGAFELLTLYRCTDFSPEPISFPESQEPANKRNAGRFSPELISFPEPQEPAKKRNAGSWNENGFFKEWFSFWNEHAQSLLLTKHN